MADAVDASSPARATNTALAVSGVLTTPSFTPPAPAVLVACVSMSSIIDMNGTQSITDSQGLTWTKKVDHSWTDSFSPSWTAVYTATVSSSVATTVNFNRGTSGGAGTPSTRLTSLKVYVLTGVDIAGTPFDSITASNQGGASGTAATTTSLTPGANGIVIINGASSSSTAGTASWTVASLTSDVLANTLDGANSVNMSIGSGYKSVSSGVGTTTGIANAAGTGGAAGIDYVQIIARESTGGGASTATVAWMHA